MEPNALGADAAARKTVCGCVVEPAGLIIWEWYP